MDNRVVVTVKRNNRAKVQCTKCGAQTPQFEFDPLKHEVNGKGHTLAQRFLAKHPERCVATVKVQTTTQAHATTTAQ